MIYYITALSLVNPERSDILRYPFHDGVEYEGIFASEAAARYTISHLAQEGRVVDRFILFMSYDCMAKVFDFGDVALPGQILEYLSDLHNVSTYQYFSAAVRDEMTNAMKLYPELQSLLSEQYGGMDGYLDEAMGFSEDNMTIISDNPDISELKKAIQEGLGIDESMQIYMDITGGSRISSLVAMLFTNWYENNWNASVEKVLYASYMGDEPKLIDWTENYEIIQIADPKKRLDELDLNLDNEDGIASIEDMDDLLSIAREAGRRVVSYSVKELESRRCRLEKAVEILNEEPPSMEVVLYLRIFLKAIDNLKKTSVERLKDRSEQEDKGGFIHAFYESIIENLVDRDLLKPSSSYIRDNKKKRVVKNVIDGVRRYYGDVKNTKNMGGVVGFCYVLIEDLENHKEEDPSERLERRFSLTNETYMGWREPPYPLRGANSNLNRHFIGMIRDEINLESMDESGLLEYERLRNLYFNFGFPFCCLDDGNWRHEDVRRYYINAVKRFVKKQIRPKWLDYSRAKGEIKKEKLAEYTAMLREYKDYDRLDIEMPALPMPRSLTINQTKFKGQEEARRFMDSFNDLYSEARKFRNAVAHPELKKMEYYLDSARQKEMAEKIRVWLDRYGSILEK